MGYFWIAVTVALTAYGQLVLKWRMNELGPLPAEVSAAPGYFLRALTDLYVLSTFVAAFVASLAWMAAVSRFEVSFAYPFMALAFVIVLVGGWLLLGETMTLNKVACVLLIVAGLWIGSR